MAIDAPAAALIGAAIGAIAGVSGSIVTVWMTQAHESERHLRETIFKTAFDQWTTDRKFAESRNLSMPPLITHLIGTMKLAEVADKRKITADRAPAWTGEHNAVVSAVQRENVEFTRRDQGEQKPNRRQESPDE